MAPRPRLQESRRTSELTRCRGADHGDLRGPPGLGAATASEMHHAPHRTSDVRSVRMTGNEARGLFFGHLFRHLAPSFEPRDWLRHVLRAP